MIFMGDIAFFDVTPLNGSGFVADWRAAAELNLGKYAAWTDPDRIANNMARLFSEFRGTIGTNQDREATQAAVAEYFQLKGRR